MKSHIKKNDILEYILNQFNDDNATQDITFVMGSEGMPLYKPISFEGAGGVPEAPQCCARLPERDGCQDAGIQSAQ